MRPLICIMAATSVPGKCDSLPFGALFFFMVTRVSPGILKEKNCRSSSTKLERYGGFLLCLQTDALLVSLGRAH